MLQKIAYTYTLRNLCVLGSSSSSEYCRLQKNNSLFKLKIKFI